MHGWIKLLTGSTKKHGREFEMGQKDRRRNIGRPKQKRKKEIKTGMDFWAAENLKFDSNGFLFKNYLKQM
jgi:hypothetical protein